ncbi:MAG: phenylacetic acid degradation bifunctional protein PaaZ [Rhodobacteraceae bacterium]|nr:phenylacetic acid degradation bifunctional protein PaaZ [Paracoccaceae bacterium]
MPVIAVESFLKGAWVTPAATAVHIRSAINGRVIARSGHAGFDAQAVIDYARLIGGPALREMTFHDRARKLKELALYIRERREVLYELSFDTGGTLSDHKIDVDGGIGTMLVISSKGRRDLPDANICLDGEVEALSRQGSFVGQHIMTPLQGVGVHINAFNFPVWGLMEKLAPCLLAGVPAIVKPATATVQVAEAAFRMMVESGIFPDGAIQFVAGSVGDLLDRLGPQDVVGFTGSAETALKLRSNPSIMRSATRFMSEQDSLNASVLGPDAGPGTVEFDLFSKEVSQEMTARAGQKCTAIRRIMVPEIFAGDVAEAIEARLANVQVGDPHDPATGMGALVNNGQKADVLEKAGLIGSEARLVFGEMNRFAPAGSGMENGAFMPPMLFQCADPDVADHVHRTEAFGPVSTLMGYRDASHAAELVNRGGGSLVSSVITADPDFAAQIARRSAAFNGRLYFNNADSMAESTGHGSPVPHMVHGGPGRAGGGEELGGVRGAFHYMQRTAIQGAPGIIAAVGQTWVPGADRSEPPRHPFRLRMSGLSPGQSITTDAREVTEEDIEHFARFTGDTFYAHMDEDAARANPFFPGRVAHGYLLLSFAAGLFVDPDPGPVLANTGLNNLRFQKPVSPGDSIRATLTVRRMTRRNHDYGEVRWHVCLTNQDDDQVAEYELLTMNAL